ncbi:ATP-dependent helicase RRM3-like protein [Aphelenchoides avenae]|nr:ATP-dependent helicase RRM3-like protein [Aphelenchus avenae]
MVAYRSVNKFILDNSTSRLMEEMPVEVMESANPSGLPPHELNLKVGAVIMLMRNLNVRDALCNGTRLLITRLGQRVIEAVHISGDIQGRKVWIPRIGLRSSESNLKLPWSFKRTQFPVRPAFCLTINKSQGQTFDRVGIDLTEEVFSHGQLYVALSRVRSMDGVRVLTEQLGSPLRNIVFKEVLQEELTVQDAN